MCERREAGVVKRRDQDACRKSGRLGGIVVLDLAAVGQLTKFLQEHGDQVGCRLQEGLVRVGAQRRQRLEPLGRCAMLVKLAFFDLGRLADLPLRFRPADHDEVPRLQVGAARRRTRGLERGFDDVPRDGSRREVPNGSA